MFLQSFFLFVYFCIAGSAAGAGAESVKDTEKVYLYRIVVSPLRVPQELLHVAQNVELLEGEELERMPANNPAEALAHAAGVDVSLRTGFGHLTPLSIQGY